MSDKHYETYTTYVCPKCGWDNICITDPRRWIKEYVKKNDVVYWTCPDCGFCDMKGAFQVIHKNDVTEEVHDKEAYWKLTQKINEAMADAEVRGEPLKRLSVSMDEYSLLKRQMLREPTYDTVSSSSVMHFRGIPVEMKEK